MSDTPEKLLRSLAAIAGEENTSADAATIDPYAIDGIKPRVVVRPGSVDEVGEILRLCATEKFTVIPAGGGTKLAMGAPPSGYDVALATTRLNRVHGYDPGDLTVSVEPGVRMSDLSAKLAEHGQFLPLAVPFERHATIGGTVAAGVDSPLRQSYGTTRDFLLGAEFVTGAGNPAKSGGRVVKNVAGYDLHKLYIGSFGTLGVLTRMNFKTFPRAEKNLGLIAAFDEQPAALDFVQRIRQSPLEPASIELLSPSLAGLFAMRSAPDAPQSTPLGPWFPSAQWVVAVGYGGSEPLLRRFTNDLGAMAADAGAKGTVPLDDAQWTAVWERLREAAPLLLDSSPAATIARVGVLPSRAGEILSAASRSGERNALPMALLARGAGAVYVAFLPETAEGATLDSLARAATEISQAAAAAHGFCSIPWCPAELKDRVPLWGSARPDLGLMRKVKQVFDPEGILSPGRFAGGI